MIEIKNLSKKYGEEEVLKKINFKINDNEFLSILGASGCGKTTLIRLLIGLEKATTGEIIKDGIDITNINPSLREMGIVFQDYALFPNMNVLKNIEYAMKHKKIENYHEKAKEIIKKVGLEKHINKKPSELSGGQQQRVAIARTLVLNPKVILLDEPMSALDAENRLNLRKELKELQKKFNITMIYITHDQEEAFSLSDRVLILKDGNIEQLDTPKNIFKKPKTDYVKKFVINHLITKVSDIQKCIEVDL